MSWARETFVIGAGELPAEMLGALERNALAMGIEWPFAIELAWVTTSTTVVGRLRKRERTVIVHGVLGPDVIGWTVSDDGAAPGGIVVRRSRVDVSDGDSTLAGLPPELVARAGGDPNEPGVSIRGDLGHKEIATYFMGLGAGPDGDQVRAALLG